jgi:hypothetical protein
MTERDEVFALLSRLKVLLDERMAVLMLDEHMAARGASFRTETVSPQ